MSNKKKSPESRLYDDLKGKQVSIKLSRDGTDLTATLLWVDRYTVGLRGGDGRERMMNKRSIETMERATGKLDGTGGATP